MIGFLSLSVRFVRLIIGKIHVAKFFGIDCWFVVLLSGVGKKKQLLLESWYYG